MMTGKMFPISPEGVGRGQEGKGRILESGSSMSERRQFRLITRALNKKQDNVLHGERVTLANHEPLVLTLRLQAQREV